MLQLDHELHPKKSIMVGPILSSSFTSQAIMKALKELNPEIQIVSKGAYYQAFSPSRCVLSRFTVEKYLGRHFQLPQDLELNMPSYKGRMQLVRDEIFWIS